MFVQALWSNNPREPRKLLQGKVKGTIKVLSGLFQVHTQAKLTYSFSSFHNDTINKAKKFLFSSNPLYYVVFACCLTQLVRSTLQARHEAGVDDRAVYQPHKITQWDLEGLACLC